MASTTYEIFAGGESKGTKSKKATAVEFARGLRDELKVDVEVKTSTGNSVFTLGAPKKINMSPRFTRTVELPEGVEIPEGQRVAYFRPRVGLALLHDASEDAGETPYALLDVTKGKVLKQRYATTREAGAAMTHVAKVKKEQAAAAASA